MFKRVETTKVVTDLDKKIVGYIGEPVLKSAIEDKIFKNL